MPVPLLRTLLTSLVLGFLAISAQAAPASAATAHAATSDPAPARNPAAAARQPQIFLFRGLANVFSYGMDSLSKELKQAGIDSKVYNHADWEQVAAQITKAYRANPKRTRPIVLIGHSLGANVVLIMSKSLVDAGVPVDLVVTFDPTRATPLSPGVRRYLNLYQSNNGWSEALPATAGSKRIVNSDVRQRKDLGAGLNHANIDKNRILHQQVVNEIVALVRKGAAKN